MLSNVWPVVALTPTTVTPSESLTDRWDKEWLSYFLSEDPRVFLLGQDHIEQVSDVHNKEAAEVYDTSLTKERGGKLLPPLSIWIQGSELADQGV